MEHKNVVVVGATGSVGGSVLDVCRKHKNLFRVFGLAVRSSVDKLFRLIKEFKPKCVCVLEKFPASVLEMVLKEEDMCDVEVVWGVDGLRQLVSLNEVDHVSFCSAGITSIEAIITAVKFNKEVSVANKESIIVAGDWIKKACEKTGNRLIPLDSEHSAIFQALKGEPKPTKVVITASGGPFRKYTLRQLKSVTPKKALSHPVWNMGKKITIDSATLINKGFEVIEAHYLFDIPYDAIEVLVHPQALIHAIAFWSDGTSKAVLSLPDMRIPASVALGYPERLDMSDFILPLDRLVKYGLSFEYPDIFRFPLLKIAIESAKAGTSARIALVGADEIAVEAFLDEIIGFMDIPYVIEKTVEIVSAKQVKDLKEIFDVYKLSKFVASEICDNLYLRG